MAKIKIENVVASTSLGEELDLQSIALALDGAEYEPEQFPGLIYRLKDPKTATLLFRSGKVVCTGAKSLEHVKVAINKVAKQIEKAGIKIEVEPKIEVQNIVASSDLGQEINLNAIAISLGLERVEYEPEQFPGLVYRLDDPKVVVLLFGSGKLVCTGARKPQDVETAVGQDHRGAEGGGIVTLTQVPIFDNHIHLQPQGRKVEAVKDYHKAGGTHLILSHMPYDQVPGAQRRGFHSRRMTSRSVWRKGAIGRPR